MKVLRRAAVLSAAALRRHKRELRRLRAFCRARHVDPRSEKTLLAFLADRAPNCTPTYFWVVVNSLRRVWYDRGERCPIDHARARAQIRRLALATKPLPAYRYYTPAQMRAVFDSFGGTPLDLRDSTMLALVYYAAGSSCELSAAEMRHLTITRKGLWLRVDEHRRGPITLPRLPDPRCCPVALMERWLAYRGCEPGPLFLALPGSPGFRDFELMRALAPAGVANAILRRLRACGLSGCLRALQHSMVMAAVQRGATRTQVLQQGRYLSTRPVEHLPCLRKLKLGL